MVKSLLRRVKEYFYFPTRFKMLSYTAANTVMITKLCEVAQAQQEASKIRTENTTIQNELNKYTHDRLTKLRAELDTLNKEVRKLKRGKK